MSFYDRLMLWFHVAFVIFAIGPVTLAIMATPRAIRKRNLPVLRYLSRTTLLAGSATLGVVAFGMVLGQSLGELGQTWLTVAITLFAMAIVLLVIIMRDQRRAISALEAAEEDEAIAAAESGSGGAGGPAGGPGDGSGEGGDADGGGEGGEDPGVESGSSGEGGSGSGATSGSGPTSGAGGGTGAGATTPQAVPGYYPGNASQFANVERGRIASMGGIVSLLWLAILVLMIWQP